MKYLIAACLLWGLHANAITLTSFEYTGDWTEGMSVTFEDGDSQLLDQIDSPLAPFAFTQGGQENDEGYNQITIGVPDFAVDLFYLFFYEDGAFRNSAALLPEGWSATPDFTYDPETASGSLSWAFQYTPPSNVPDGGALGLMGLLAVAGCAVTRRWLA